MAACTEFAAARRVRIGTFTPLKIDGRRVCLDCGEPVRHVLKSPRLRCDACSGLRHLNLHFLSGKMLCAYQIGRARKLGLIPPPSEFQCADCGQCRAQCYDHRDYADPLRVEPVCTRCNVLRGPARPVNPVIVSALLLAHFGEA